MVVMLWVERIFGALALVSAPAFILAGALQQHKTSTCLNGVCRAMVESDWSAHTGEVIAAVVVTIVVGLVVASLVFAHAATQSRGLLILMWVLVPLLLASVVGFAFTWIGSDAFFWGSALLFASIAGSIAQAVHAWRHRQPVGGVSTAPRG